MSSVVSVNWFFDDGSTSNNFNPKHYYKNSGTYNPIVYVETLNSLLSATTSINISPLIEESIFFETVPPPTFAGHINRYPFKVVITSKTTNDHYVDLSCIFSKSYKKTLNNKWSFLRPEYRFLDLNFKEIDKIKTIDTPIYSNGVIVGVSGYAEFYFVDDSFNSDLYIDGKPYTTIIAKLDTYKTPSKNDFEKINVLIDGYSNSKAITFHPYVFHFKKPEYLKITENGIFQHKSPKWSNIEQYLIINTDYKTILNDDILDGNPSNLKYNNSFYFNKDLPISENQSLTATVVGLSSYFTPKPEFKEFSDNFLSKGYYKGKFYLEKLSAENCYIQAFTNFEIPSVSSNYIYPFFWVSNPKAKQVCNFIYFQNQTITNSISTENLNKAYLKPINVPIVTYDDYLNTQTMRLTGYHGIYSVSVLPYPQYHAWLLDSEKSYLYRYSTNGNLLCSIDIKKIITDQKLGFLVDGYISPASMVLDSEKNIWITLYDTISTIKLNNRGEFLFATKPSIPYNIPPNVNLDWFKDIQKFESTFNSDGNNNFIEPTGIDSDTLDNVWVSYSNMMSSFLVKYSNTGNVLNTITLPVCSSPQEIVIDKQNNFWVLNYNHATQGIGSIEKRDTNGILLSSFSIRNPKHATVDSQQNLFFTFDYNKIGKIENSTGSLITTNVSSIDFENYEYDYWFDPSFNVDESLLEGIAVDFLNKVYVLNSLENQVYIYDQKNLSFIDRFYINPQGFESYIEDSDNQYSDYLEYNVLGKSLQAQGDWSGFKWVNKYGDQKLTDFNTSGFLNLSGRSNFLNFYLDSVYDVKKINENFKMANHIKDISMAPILINSNYLFDSFLSGIYDKGDEKIGEKSYEKISNFVINHSDIETCEIKNLNNFSEMLIGNQIENNYDIVYPEKIKKIVDLFSINDNLLFGNDEIKKYDTNYIKNNNPIDTTFYIVTAGDKFLIYDKNFKKTQIINTGKLYNQLNYNIQYLLTSLGLDQRDWRSRYDLYPIIEDLEVKKVENIIDWENLETNLSPKISTTYPNLYKDGGILETILTYHILKGLDYYTEE